MAADIFLKLGDIKGESEDKEHKDQIELLRFSWSGDNPGSMWTGGGGGTGKIKFNDLRFTHAFDIASNNIWQYCAGGKHVPEATLTARKSGDGQKDFFILKMTDVIITSVSYDNGDPMEENVTLQFAKVDVEYKVQKADGSLAAGNKFGYDIKGNAKT